MNVAVRETHWPKLVFFLATGLIGTFGAPLYIFRFGVTRFDILLFFFYFAATGLAITMGYHRFFSHATYKVHPLVKFFFLFFGAAAFEQSALKWSAQHRTHHLYVDSERDPYSIKKGFWYAHIGWLILWKQPTDYAHVQDLQKSPLVMNQHRYYDIWAVIAGILFPVLLGLAAGRPGAAFLLAVCLRMALVHHVTFCINSVCHWMGNKTYDAESSARDHWFVALFTFGEGYHNFHHRFPSDYRNGIRWYHWDPTKWLIVLLKFIGLAKDLKCVSYFRILHARLISEKNRTHKSFLHSPTLLHLKEQIDLKHKAIQRALVHFETAAAEYQRLLANACKLGPENYKKLKSAAADQLRQKEECFRKGYKDWRRFISLLRLNPSSQLARL